MGNNVAIVIGVNYYDHLHPSDHLKYAVRDAERIQEFLCGQVGFDPKNIVLCSDTSSPFGRWENIPTRPLRSNLRRLLLDEIQRAVQVDNLWFSFSGHGRVGKDNHDYLMPSDGYFGDLEGTAISVDFVIRCLMGCRAKNVVMTLDMCRSFSGSKGTNDVGSYTAKLAKQQGITTIFSCQQGEASYEIAELQQGAFTYALVEGLAKYETPRGLEQYLQQRVPELNYQHKKPCQLPQVSLNSAYKYDLPLLQTSARQTSKVASQSLQPLLKLSSDSQKGVNVGAPTKCQFITPLVSNTRIFNFEVVTIDTHGKEIEHRQEEAQFIVEDLDGVPLEMVVIPGGTFLMGSSEKRPLPNESPIHSVAVQPFLMSKYPVTKAQWKAIANLPQVHCKLNKVPVRAGSAAHPVVQVSWYEAVEFCERLSKKTGCEYRLPTEAEWEYACRARTETAFHFGETITPDLANYDGNFSYRSEAKGINRGEITPVRKFKFANAFGLFDMHGNVWEWCLDHWHEDYNEAPVDATAWICDLKVQERVIRSGSWLSGPTLCRSASRQSDSATSKSNTIGFRIARSL
jgi:formylglycine-generating enzyme required for sulfatase activity